jgi:hypothetical protein
MASYYKAFILPVMLNSSVFSCLPHSRVTWVARATLQELEQHYYAALAYERIILAYRYLQSQKA